jgi:hypothetical protein
MEKDSEDWARNGQKRHMRSLRAGITIWYPSNKLRMLMRYQKLGNTGLFVSELCLGTMTFGGEGGMWGKIGQLQQT